MPPLISDNKESMGKNDKFLQELKILMEFKIFNNEEMLKKRKPNSKEFINSDVLVELFKDCVIKLNEDNRIDSMTEHLFNNSEVIEKDADNDSNNSFEKIDENYEFNESVDLIGSTEDNNFLIQMSVVECAKSEEDSDGSIDCLKFDGNETESEEKTLNEKQNCCVSGDSSTLETVQNPLVSVDVQCEKSVDITFDIKTHEKLENKAKNLDRTFLGSNLKINKKSENENGNNVTQIKENLIQDSKRKNNSKFDSKLNSDTYIKTYQISGNNYQRSNSKEKKESQYSQASDLANEMRLKSFFEDTVDNCLLIYKESMENYIKKHELDINYDIDETHLSKKRDAFELYRESLNKIEPKFLTKIQR